MVLRDFPALFVDFPAAPAPMDPWTVLLHVLPYGLLRRAHRLLIDLITWSAKGGVATSGIYVVLSLLYMD